MLFSLFQQKHLQCRQFVLVMACILWFGIRSNAQYTVVYSTYVGPPPTNTGGTAGTAGVAGTLGTNGVVGTYSITGTANLNDAIYTNSATISLASGTQGSGLGGTNGGASSGYINLSFTGATTPSASNPVILNVQATNNSSLGSINPLTQVTVQAYNGVTPVGSAVALSTLTSIATNSYVFVPSGSCNSIQIKGTTDVGGGLLGLGVASTTTVNIYYAYIYDPTCNPPTYSSTNITGVALGGSITNSGNAIDNNIATFSYFSVGVGLGATLYQEIYYPKLSSAGDVATVTMAIPSAALAVGLLGSISINTFNGSTPTGSVSYSALLQGTDLLTLLQSGAAATISFVPTAPFNRIEISMASVAAVSGSLNLYEVAVTAARPTLSSDTAYACYGTTATVTATAPATNYELRWFATGAASDQTALYTGNTYTTAYNVTADTVVWVAQYRTGCQQGSEKRKIKILVNPLPTITLGTNPIICILGTNAILPYSATTNSPTTYSITWSGSYGLSNIVNSTLLANNILINIPAGQSVGVKSATLTVKNAKGCVSNPANNMSVTVKSPPVVAPPISISYQ